MGRRPFWAVDLCKLRVLTWFSTEIVESQGRIVNERSLP